MDIKREHIVKKVRIVFRLHEENAIFKETNAIFRLDEKNAIFLETQFSDYTKKCNFQKTEKMRLP